MIFVYNQTGKPIKLVAKETEKGVDLNLLVGGWSAEHKITSTTNEEAKKAFLTRFTKDEPAIETKISRHYVILKTGREMFDAKTMNFGIADFNTRYDDNSAKHMVVLLLQKGSRFHIDKKDIVGEPVFDSNFSTNVVMIKVLIKWVLWKSRNGKLKAYIENPKPLCNVELSMVGATFNKTKSSADKEQYRVNTIFDKEFDQKIPKMNEPKFSKSYNKTESSKKPYRPNNKDNKDSSKKPYKSSGNKVRTDNKNGYGKNNKGHNKRPSNGKRNSK